jgi:tyrosinase
VLDGLTIQNPLKSFVFNRSIKDFISGDNPNYSKPLGYETVRYPLSGLVGNDAEKTATKAHNAKYPNYARNVDLLNRNVVRWLTTQSIIIDPKNPINANVHQKYLDCLNAPNYMLFSNTSSADQWNVDHNTKIVPLESPHNNIHLAVGGFDVPKQTDYSPIAGANGDMGENDTAGLDPIFYFHHCFVDYVFWRWQKKHGKTNSIDIALPQYPGTNTVDNQGPTPGMPPNTWLTLDSPLAPFTRGDGRVYTSLDAVDIEKQLGYTFGPGSLDPISQPLVPLAKMSTIEPTKAIHVSGLDRSRIRGSFLIAGYATVNGEKIYLGSEAILSRWNVRGCVNCQAHLETRAAISLHGLADTALANATYGVEVHTHDGILGAGLPLDAHGQRPFRFEVR